MFGHAITLCTILGFRIRVDWSWLILAVLIAWSLATGLFPHLYEEAQLAEGTRWAMGAAGALGLFVSIVLHELGHAVVARRFGIEMRGITLFIFGGVAEMTDEPPHAKAELQVAIAGPIVSIVLGGLFLVLGIVAGGAGVPLPIVAVAAWLGWVNLVLAAFNLVPAFPLDGGRVLRAMLWRRWGDLRRATRTTSSIGAGFGMVLIVLGVLSFIGGNVVGGIWWVVLGMFLRGAASASYQQVLVRRALEGERIDRFMTRDPVVVAPGETIAAFVDEWFHRHYHKLYPVVDDGVLRGVVVIDRVREVPREAWGERTVGEIAAAPSDGNTIDAGTDAADALARLHRSSASRMAVVEGGRLVGVIALKDLLEFLATKAAFEDLERP